MNLSEQDQIIAEFFEAVKGASLVLLRLEDVIPIAYILTESGITPMAVPVCDGTAKDITKKVVSALCKMSSVFAIVSESWISKIKTQAEAANATPSTDPERKEAIVALLFVDGKQQCMAVMFFERKDDKVIYGQWQETGTHISHAEFGGIYPEATL